MADHLDDIERVDQIKTWLSKYAGPIIIGAFLGLVMIYGWQFWQGRQLKYHTMAAAMYQTVTQAWLGATDTQKQTLANQLATQYPNTVYADFAYLALADLAVSQQDLNQAAQYLNKVARDSQDHGLQTIAKIRLARVLGSEGKVKDGLAILDTIKNSSSFTLLVDDTRGDLYVLADNNQAATKAYQAALASSSDASKLLPLLPYKLQQISASGEQLS